MTAGKRAFDLGLAVLIAVPVAVLVAAVAIAQLVLEGRPVFYRSERMRDPGHGFWLWKFRTMRPSAVDRGVSGGDKAGRITGFGAFLRKSRLDELPQLWNILRGDMSFVGPRPPLRSYVERYPDIYARVLRNRPGVTGLASMVYHRHEALILDRCATAEETDRAYTRRCIPSKARLDLIYQRNRSACLDLWILWATVFGRNRRRRYR